MEHGEHVREECWGQKVAFITFEDIWLEFRKADKAIETALHFIKLCISKLKENFVLLEQSVTKY